MTRFILTGLVSVALAAALVTDLRRAAHAVVAEEVAVVVAALVVAVEAAVAAAV